MGENYLFKYNVDMVFCIDATASMRPVINTVKNNALNFYHDVTAAMERKGKHINEMRIRVIAFRDYLADGDSAMMTTDFFRLPEQSKDFVCKKYSCKRRRGYTGRRSGGFGICN